MPHLPPSTIARRHPAPARLALLPVTALLAAGLLLAGCAPKEVAPEPKRAVRTLQVGALGGSTRRDFAADVRARNEARLGFRVGGKLLSRAVNVGDHVRAGQVLAQLDPADLKLGEDAARAALTAAQVNYDQTALDTRRYADLRAQGFISAADLERRETALKAAKAQLDQAKAQVGVQGNQTAYTSLVADAPGIVTEVSADPGTVVAAGTPIVRVAYDGPRDVVFAVPEDQLNPLRALRGKPGALTVSLWAGGTPFKATVREVSSAADAVTRTFAVKADLPAGAAELGQTATVQVELAAADGLLRLPVAALTTQKGQSAVWVLDKAAMSVRAQLVDVARTEGDSVVIAKGLKAGDVVVTAGAHVLQPGQVVSLYNEPVAR